MSILPLHTKPFSQNSSDQNDGKAKISLFYKPKAIQASLLLVSFLVNFLPVNFVQASFFNSFSPNEAFGDEISTDNSQTVALLDGSPVHIAYEPDITIDNFALVAGTGPIGGQAATAEYDDSSDQFTIYVVLSGDTIGTIAEMFGVSVNTIRWANDLKKDGTVGIGQTLVILPISGIKHKVVKGETVASIAKKFGGDVDEIIQLNDDVSATGALAVGMELIIPDGEMGTPISTIAKTSTSKTVSKSKTKSKERTYGTSGPNLGSYFASPIAGARCTQDLHAHNGIDIGAATGTPIKAAAEGTVIIARSGGWGGGFGSYVVVNHSNGTQTLYAHMSKVLTQVGAHVDKGEVIGKVGSTGKSTGPHLHVEVHGAKNTLCK